jgi:hypothetical protein
VQSTLAVWLGLQSGLAYEDGDGPAGQSRGRKGALPAG